MGRVAFANIVSKRRERSCILKSYERRLLFAFLTSIDGYAATFPEGDSNDGENRRKATKGGASAADDFTYRKINFILRSEI